MAAVLFNLPTSRVIDTNGIADGSTLTFYDTGTLAKRAIYTDSGLTVEHPNPITVASGAAVPNIYLDDTYTYRCIVRNSDGATIDDIDPYTKMASSGVTVPDGRSLAAWIGGRMVDAAQYGVSTSNTAAQNVTAFEALFTALAGGTYPVTVLVKPGTYPMGLLSISSGNIHIWAYGATFTGSTVRFSCDADNFKIFGARIVDTDSTGANFGINFVGDQNGLYDCTLVKTPEAGGYHGYIQLTATNCILDNLTLRGSNGIFVEGTGHRFTNIDAIARASGGDDLFAVKARNQRTGDIIISSVTAEGYSNVVAIGSEVGTLGAASASRAGRVTNLTAKDLVAVNCTYLYFIKPGAIDAGSAYDWRDGLVRNVEISGQIEDMEGARRVRDGVISASRGALVDDVRVTQAGSGRCYVSGGGEYRAGLDIYIPDYSAATPAAAAPTIKNIKARVRCFDPDFGAASGGSAPGGPMQSLVRVAKQTSSHGTMSNIDIEVEGDGCSESGILISAGLDEAVSIRRAAFKNADASNSGGGGVKSLSHVRIGDIAVDVISGGTGYPITANGATYYHTKTDRTRVTGTSAGTGLLLDVNVYSPSRDCYINRVEVIPDTAITQDETNYLTLEIYNTLTGATLASRTTRASDGANFAAHTTTALHSTDSIASANAYDIPRQTSVRLRVTGSGTGQTVPNMLVVTHYIEHGA